MNYKSKYGERKKGKPSGLANTPLGLKPDTDSGIALHT